MYLMCLFQSLPHAADELHQSEASPDPADQSEQSPEPADQSEEAEGVQSRPLSTATGGSCELAGYGAALEDVLTWLLDAEERLAAAPPLPEDDLMQLKQLFHDHEVGTVRLASIVLVCEVDFLWARLGGVKSNLRFTRSRTVDGT